MPPPQVAFGRTMPYAGVGAASRPPPRRQPFGRVNPSAVNNNNTLAPSAAGHAKPSCWIGSANTAPLPSKQQQHRRSSGLADERSLAEFGGASWA